jgi:hypothetical protein
MHAMRMHADGLLHPANAISRDGAQCGRDVNLAREHL